MPDATERKALAICAFVGACLAFAPMDFVSGGMLLALSAILFALHGWITRREEALLRSLDAWVAEPAAVTEAEAEPAAVTEAEPAAEPVMRSETPLGT